MPTSTLAGMRRVLADLWDLCCIGAPALAVVGAPAAVVAVWWGGGDRWWLALVLGVVAVSAAVFTWWPRRRMSAPVAGDGLRIVASNLWFKNPVPEQAARDLLALEPDVLVISELEPPADEVLTAAFAHREVVRVGGPRGHGVYSRFPIERLEQPDLIGPVLLVRVHADVPFQLYASHLPRATLTEHDTEGPEILHACRRDQFGLAALLDRDPAAVVAGDLNLTDRQPGYRRLVRGRLDAMRTGRAADTFLGVTWRLMAMRIDHLIVPAGWAVRDARAVRVTGSDHRAITAVVDPVRR